MVKARLSLCLINYAPRHKDIWGSGGKAPTLLTLALNGGEYSASCPGCFTPGEESLVPTGQEAGWAPELVWMLWREKSLAPAGIASKFCGLTKLYLSFWSSTNYIQLKKSKLIGVLNWLTHLYRTYSPYWIYNKENKKFLFTKLLLWIKLQSCDYPVANHIG
jgi:hypothetical protein